MKSKYLHSSLRVSFSQKEILNDIGIGVKRVFEVGLNALKLTAQRGTFPSCKYISRKGGESVRPAPLVEDTSRVDPTRSAQPEKECCSSCPIRLAFNRKWTKGESKIPGSSQVQDQDLIEFARADRFSELITYLI